MSPARSFFRHRLILALYVLAAVLVLARLLHLQYIQREALREKGAQASMQIWQEEAIRGLILDREGETLAISTPVSWLILNPMLMLKDSQSKAQRLADKCRKNADAHQDCSALLANEALYLRQKRLQIWTPLAELLQEKPETLLQQISERPQHGHWRYPQHLTPQQIDDIMRLRLEGVGRENGFQRFYPSMEVMARVLGFTGKGQDGREGRGLGGIEWQFDSWLAGDAGEYRVLQSRGGGIIRVLDNIKPAVPGRHVQLSIDLRIQRIMHEVLENTLREHQALRVSAVLVHTQTGEILGMVSLPTGNPNHRLERSPELLKNPVIENAFEPGSIIKPLVVLAALEENIITPQTQFRTHGVYYVGRSPISDTKNHGVLDTKGVIAHSSNIGMVMIAERFPRAKFYRHMRNMGFGQYVLNFAGENVGVLRNPEKGPIIDYVTTSYGYGISTTLLQMAQAYVMLANDGVKIPLTLLKRQQAPEGQRIFSARATQQVRAMLEEVVIRGTGKRASNAFYTVAGKTGTAWKPKMVPVKQKDGSQRLQQRGYESKRYLSLFAGFAPAQQPQIALVVLVDEPRAGRHYGGAVAAPSFSAIIAQSLNVLGVLPDKVAPSRGFTIQSKAEEP